MKTDLNKYYFLRNMDEAHGKIDGWLGHRKNGSLYSKRFQGGAAEFKGGPKLDVALQKHGNFKAYEV